MGSQAAPSVATARRHSSSGAGPRSLLLYYVIGVVSAIVVLMSIIDLFVPKPWDGIEVRYGDSEGIEVEAVAEASPAAAAGIEPGDRIIGIGEQIVTRPTDVARELVRHRIGEKVPYLIDHGGKFRSVDVWPTATVLGTSFHRYIAVLSVLFFGIGLFVLTQQREAESARVFFLLCDLFMIFLACRLRPSSWYWIDFFVQKAGTLALFLLPAVFLHFFLIFPRAKRWSLLGDDDPWADPPSALRLRLDRLLAHPHAILAVVYLLPPLVYLLPLPGEATSSRLLSGATANWVLLGNYLVAGLVALVHSWVTAGDERERRQILPVLLGVVFGVGPFVLLAVVLPSLTDDDSTVFWGTLPLALVPLAFGYAIIRYQLLNVRLVVRKGFLYAATTALISGVYALAIATANRLLSEQRALSSTIGFVVAIGVVLLFDPLRKRLQAPIDRLFFRDRVDFAEAVHDMSEAIRGELARDRIQDVLTRRVPEVTRAAGCWLYLPATEGPGGFAPAGGDPAAPARLPSDGSLAAELGREPLPRRIEALLRQAHDPSCGEFLRRAADAGVRLAVPLVYRGRLMGVLFLKERKSEEEYGREELDLLSTLANQAAVALETANLHDESTRQVELARDLEIAREIQMSLFPSVLPAPEGFELHAASVPAKVVGGDFYDAIPLDGGGPTAPVALLLGDVSGKSIPASLLMVASREIVFAAARAEGDPSRVFRSANERIYSIKRRMFVALGYYVLDPVRFTLSYSIAGMPTPLLCRVGGRAPETIPEPEIRMPLGALRDVPYDFRELALRAGDLLFLYSDGFSEAIDSSGEPFGDERLERLLWSLRDRPLPEIGDRLMEELRRFSAGMEPYDDTTFLLLRVGGMKPLPDARV